MKEEKKRRVRNVNPIHELVLKTVVAKGDTTRTVEEVFDCWAPAYFRNIEWNKYRSSLYEDPKMKNSVLLRDAEGWFWKTREVNSGKTYHQRSVQDTKTPVEGGVRATFLHKTHPSLLSPLAQQLQKELEESGEKPLTVIKERLEQPSPPPDEPRLTEEEITRLSRQAYEEQMKLMRSGPPDPDEENNELSVEDIWR